MIVDVLKVLVAVAVAVVLYLIGAFMVRSFTMNQPPPNEPPEPEDMTPVDYRYRCIVCGAAVTMTAAPSDEVPDPPRHCREDMQLVVEEESG
jgi:hypothetical protein